MQPPDELRKEAETLLAEAAALRALAAELRRSAYLDYYRAVVDLMVLCRLMR